MFDNCMRCGKPIIPGQRISEVTLHGETGRQHATCGEFYRGTTVHWRAEPETHARQEVYSHDWGDGITFVFNVSALRWRAIHQSRKPLELPIESAQIKGMMHARSMAPEDAQAVMFRRIRQGTFDAPGVLVYHPHRGGSLIVDGNHRYVARAMLGERTMRFYLFDYSEMGSDMLSNVDPSLIERFSVTDNRWGV